MYTGGKDMYQSVRCTVKIGNVLSQRFSTKSGVKQVCIHVLSPILVSLFINDLKHNFDESCDQVQIGDRLMYVLCMQMLLYYNQMDLVKRIWYLSPMRAAKVQASLRIRAVSPEPSLLAHTSSESRGTFTQKARSLAPLIGWACAVKICHDGMVEDTNSLDGAQIVLVPYKNC